MINQRGQAKKVIHLNIDKINSTVELRNKRKFQRFIKRFAETIIAV